MKNTINHMQNTYDPVKAGNGPMKFVSMIRWKRVSETRELNKQYMERTGMDNNKFYNLKKVGRIESRYEKKHRKEMLATLSPIKIVVNKEELEKKKKEKQQFVEQQQNNIKYHLPTIEDLAMFSVFDTQIDEKPPPTPPPKDYRSYSAMELFGLMERQL